MCCVGATNYTNANGNFFTLQKLRFSEGSEGFELWRQPPVDVFLKVYLYNITNKEKFLAGEEKLKVQEVGPYVYR